MTKPLVAAAAMQLVERNELDLDTDASGICPALGRAQVLVGRDPGGRPVLAPPNTATTLRHPGDARVGCPPTGAHVRSWYALGIRHRFGVSSALPTALWSR